MNLHRTRLFAALLALATVAYGCVEDGGGDDRDDADAPDASPRDGAVDGAPRPDGDIDDAGPDPDARPPDMGPEPDMAPDPDMGREPDAEVIGPIESCEAACNRVAACERLDIFGDYDACLTACQRASRREPPENWFTCLELEQNCGLIQLCRLPDPPPLTCAETCAAVDRCAVDVPFPDCEAECEARNGADAENPRFALCGEQLDGECDPDGFWGCLGDTVYTACAARCEVTVECNLERPDGCLQACVAEGFVDDPLARLRGTQRTQCIGRVGGDCLRADACLNPQAAPPPVDRATFCQLWDRCAGDFGFPCEEAWQIAGEEPGFAECVVAEFRNGCPPDPFLVFELCFDGGGPVGPGCAELCEARDICGDLPAGQDRLGCLRECGDALQGGDPGGAQRVRAQFPCGVAESCDALAECLVETSPAAACAQHCAALGGCGLGDADCEAECDALFFSARQTAFRACVGEAGDDCDAMALCDPGRPVGCVERCARQRACRNAELGCEALCDDESFANPALAARRLACVLSAPLCNDGETPVWRCDGEPDAAGRACLNWCRAQTDCDAADIDGLVECVVACGEGFVGDDGLRFAEARACLAAESAAAACARLDACIPAVPSLDCAGWCDPLAACDAGPADCGAVCPEDELARLRGVVQPPCFAEGGGACDAVLACVEGVEAGPPPVDAEAVCARYRACGLEEFFPCDFFREEPGMLRCVAGLLDPCPRDPFLVIELCLGGRPADPETLAPCTALCTARGRCGQIDEPIRDCASTCVDGLRRNPNGPLAAVLDCADALTCPDLATCVRDSGPAGLCADVCRTAVDCGAFPDTDACLDPCGDTLISPLAPRTYLADVAACLADLEPAQCAAEGAACFEVLRDGDCADACAAIVGCGFDEGGGIDECLFGCQQSPDAALIIPCILANLQPPNRCDIEAVDACVNAQLPDGPDDPDEPPPPPPEPF